MLKGAPWVLGTIAAALAASGTEHGDSNADHGTGAAPGIKLEARPPLGLDTRGGPDGPDGANRFFGRANACGTRASNVAQRVVVRLGDDRRSQSPLPIRLPKPRSSAAV